MNVRCDKTVAGRAWSRAERSQAVSLGGVASLHLLFRQATSRGSGIHSERLTWNGVDSEIPRPLIAKNAMNGAQLLSESCFRLDERGTRRAPWAEAPEPFGSVFGTAKQLAEKVRRASKMGAAKMAGAKARHSFDEAYRHE
jgi:hypothetical protein